MGDLEALRHRLLADLATVSDLEGLEALRVSVLGKKGSLTAAFAALRDLSGDDKRAAGQALNTVKVTVEEAITARAQTLKNQALQAQIAAQALDMTLPPVTTGVGRRHPLSRTLEDIVALFARQGFVLHHGPDVEDDEHNFGALNFPPHHPARQMHDTFYVDQADAKGNPMLLRTHTSCVQIHALKGATLPARILAAGRTYRCDSDQTHTPMFHQVEGVVIEDGITMAHLRGCLETFLADFFERDRVDIRFRPSYFPFTEPSAEVDIRCRRDASGLVIGEGDDWLEVLGCGMIHPNVLTACGVDAAHHQGFAFGLGVERLAMLKYGISDLRMFFQNDGRWLRHFGFVE
ncbi:MAG: phenylalanine--tRNA ligase subunit alpha [Alphaproteobacteria bacterium]